MSEKLRSPLPALSRAQALLLTSLSNILGAKGWSLFLSIALLNSCTESSRDDKTSGRPLFGDHLKEGGASLVIVGDYFHSEFMSELVEIARNLTVFGPPTFVCRHRARGSLSRLLETNNIRNVKFVTFDDGAPIVDEWARDVAIFGTRDDNPFVVVSPDKHATTREQAEATSNVMQRIAGTAHVELAPFVFETGNIVFVDSDHGTVLVVGRKILFDNETYQNNPWAAGLSGEMLMHAIQKTFAVDSVVVVGQAITRPKGRLYFEYHIDMGLTVLSDRRAVVSQLCFTPADNANLNAAIKTDDAVISPFRNSEAGPDALASILSARIATVAAEYEEYATTLEGLGLDVHRSPVTWQHVLSSMSWTNVLQAGKQIFMPLYPDSILGHVVSVAESGGHIEVKLDVTQIEKETFRLTGYNAANYRLYQDLGYQVVVVPEYLHYYMGGLHCLVNILE